ncbi:MULTISPECIES: glycosyltransferase family 9 protein [unclassified Mucilaginibacter]|uniref:glycosyltransferase family 9 protein n=1 Tax=unclassified Mucilaginibacter TaxID=2617802 RepID=UPI002AC9436A|nr:MULTISPECIES: glycosyltransferase family 9 protein [unclassified Mucilaginibacter]MEB0262780.1 glycosyltransferase family 9 protein [Mucilaginibacter sp. 10I4]MEB0280206.1 glycosyltransferase family 9 protein [Mucilaginibacter sp. 10B2]MEB0301171.1 glycosyltransferase family 9 protein [Mucilaginibacter sp. 5C4]WPX24385.1 glycosyltransferase family 9 protein [Mucilaginibacter sp. 5C4]
MNCILISRTDAIGDVVLTLPMAGYLKELYPAARILFLGKSYTGSVIKCDKFVDEFVDYTELLKLSDQEQTTFLQQKNIDAIVHVFPNKHVAKLAKQAGIKTRIGTTNRIFHWFTCNKLVKLSRKKSDLHESQLNLVLLKPLGLKEIQPLPQVIAHTSLKPTLELPAKFEALFDKEKFNLILHPKSHGSGVEWGLCNCKKLADALPANSYKIFITGSDKEKELLTPWIKTLPAHAVDVTGTMSLDEFIAFINRADGLLASGTGPLHVAAALGIHALGLFPSVRPIHPGRWAPLGKKAEYLESGNGDLESISVDMVAAKINNWK